MRYGLYVRVIVLSLSAREVSKLVILKQHRIIRYQHMIMQRQIIETFPEHVACWQFLKFMRMCRALQINVGVPMRYLVREADDLLWLASLYHDEKAMVEVQVSYQPLGPRYAHY